MVHAGVLFPILFIDLQPFPNGGSKAKCGEADVRASRAKRGCSRKRGCFGVSQVSGASDVVVSLISGRCFGVGI